jgi:hypothetical protein
VADPADIDPPGKGPVPSYENQNDGPMIYFEIAPAYGVMSEIVQVELGARVLPSVRTVAGLAALPHEPI